ncbi:MAG: hypothetical protein STSR0008_16080 [Ignavibacterium sp.]
MILKLINIELYKIFKKWRTFIGFIAIAILVSIIQISLKIEGMNYINQLTQNLQQNFILIGNLLNGYLIAYIVLQSLYIHIPFLITLVGGDLLAGEATSGTYRMLLTRPISRNEIILAKFISGIIYTITLIFFLIVLSLGLSLLLFGSGELIVMRDKIIVFPIDDILWRFALAYTYAILSMCVVISLSFLFSSLVENAIGPIISTMTVIIIFIVLSNIDINIFQNIKPLLFTTYLPYWRFFFDDPIDFYELLKGILILSGHIIFFFLLTLFIFRRKDILS